MDGEPVVRLPEQAGDVSIGTAAGSVTNNQGADIRDVLTFVREFTFRIDQARETQDKQVRAELEALKAKLDKRERYAADEARIASEALGAIRGQVERLTELKDAELIERRERQGQRDATDARLIAGQSDLRRWLIGLTLALVVVVAVVVAVVADRLGVMAVALLVATLAARLGR